MIRAEYSKCSVCGKRSTQLCDGLMPLDPEMVVEVGDALWHVANGMMFHVWMVDGGDVTVGTKPPGGCSSGILQGVTLQRVREATRKVCSKPLCKRCSVRIGESDYCKDCRNCSSHRE